MLAKHSSRGIRSLMRGSMYCSVWAGWISSSRLRESIDLGAMGFRGGGAVLLLLLMVVVATAAGAAPSTCESMGVEHRETFRSPGIKLRPGDVTNKYVQVESPPGRFATRGFTGELVYENGNSVPLSEVYLHHWVLAESFVPPVGQDQKVQLLEKDLDQEMAAVSMHPAHVFKGVVPNQTIILAKGAESRRVNFTFPAPYAIVNSIPLQGHRSVWLLNVHGIDTRGAAHRMGCTECRCDLFTGWNATDVPDGYKGGLRCCSDEARCLLRDDFNGDDETLEQTVYLKYTWTYTTLDECVVPLSRMVIDVTDHAVEFDVEGSCKAEDAGKPECVDVQEIVVTSKYSGDLVYAVSHLHTSGLDAFLWGEDGCLICHSPPIYGRGTAAGDEEGYVVGIRSCNPSLSPNGAGKIRKGEKLRFQVKYSRVDGPHTGVMGLLFMYFDAEPELATPVAFHGSGNRKLIF